MLGWAYKVYIGPTKGPFQGLPPSAPLPPAPPRLMNGEHLKIGDFAKLAGTNLRTLRYYEELGLIEPASRSNGGFRYYRPSDAHRVRLIQNLQHLGLQLEQIGELITPGELPAGGDPQTHWRNRVDSALAQQEALLDERIRFLESQKVDVAAARAKLSDCASCEARPDESNNFCEPCALTGMSLPHLLSALFR